MKKNEKIIILGAGLSGLTLGYLLTKKNADVTILEASNRIGGRIQTIKGKLETPLELGATWFSDLHVNLLSLLDELGLHKYPQFSEGISLFQTKSFEPAQKFFVPKSEAPSYRLENGTQTLTDTLAQKLNTKNILLNEQAVEIIDQKDSLVVQTINGNSFTADQVILCLPPQLASRIHFSAELNNAITEILPTVQTWMAGSIKFVLEYDNPFWRNEGYSGMLYSHAGIVVEMYDHTNFKKDKFGFTGFLNGGAAAYQQDVRKEFVLKQLSELLGEKAKNPVFYKDKLWNDEFLISGNPVIHRPHQNNGHYLLQESYMEGKLFFCGTESSEDFGGYMEGAIIAANRIFKVLKSID